MNLKIHIFLSLLLIIYYIVKPCKCWEFCKPEIQSKLCKPNENHTVCDPEHAFPDTVNFIAEKFLAHVPLTKKFKRIILTTHNDYRNRVASGNEVKNASDGTTTPFPGAARMRELIWDNELAYVAHVHTRQVSNSQDKCRNTQRFRNSGQVTGIKTEHSYIFALNVVIDCLETTYKEKNNVQDPATTPDKLTIDHLTGGSSFYLTMVNDRISRVGCALAMGENCGNKNKTPMEIIKWCYYFICNYDFANEVGKYIYKTSTTPGSRCKDWNTELSTEYTYLCHNTGEYFDPAVEVGE